MILAVYQIDRERDNDGLKFCSYDIFKKKGLEKPDAEIYGKVFDDELDCSNLESVYTRLNTESPVGFTGHSLSVSDIIEVKEKVENTEPGFYFCDSFGFEKVKFDAEKAHESPVQNKMRVVLLEPGKLARVADIDSSLEGMQSVVGGDIEPFYPYEEEVCIVCDEEGKLKGSPLNRAVYNEDGEMVEIVAGTAFICDCRGENFGSLTEEQQIRFAKQFKYPENFFRINNSIHAIKYNPEREDKDAR